MSENNPGNFTRPSWDEYFMNIVHAVGQRGTCDRGRSGCVVVKDKRILTTGYVGSPSGMPHCDEIGHQMKTVTHEDGSISKHCLRTAHAEANAISQAARFGISLEGGTLYSKMTPCDVCAKLLINAGIKRVVSEKFYHRGASELLKQAGIEIVVLKQELEKYDKQ